jgi:type II secretory pathway component PulF
MEETAPTRPPDGGVSTLACAHATLQPGQRCPGCGKLYGLLLAKGLIGSPKVSAPPVTPLQRAWLDHPLLGLLRHRRQLTFFRQLHSLLKAGLGLPVAFADLRRSASSDAERQAIDRLARAIEAGSTLGDAARQDPLHFDPISVELLIAAEHSGGLVPMLERQLERMEEAQSLRWKVVAAALYPSYLLGALLFLGPALELPAAAAAAHGQLGSMGSVYLHGLIRNVILAGLGVSFLLCWPLAIAMLGLEPLWDRVLLAVPLVGAVKRDLQASRFCEALGAARGAGLEVDQSLTLAVRASGSRASLQRLDAARGAIARGGTLADAIELLGVVPGPSLGQISTAERTGNLDSVAALLSRDHAGSASRLLRVVMVLVMGAVVLLGMALMVLEIAGVVLGPIGDYYKALTKES